MSVDPRDFIDMFKVEVKPSALVETPLSEADFDEDEHMVIYSTERVDDELVVEFTTREGAESLIKEWNYTLDFHREGILYLRTPNSDTNPDTDAYLMFQSRV